jgi:Disulphide bond corrector protein DsbC
MRAMRRIWCVALVVGLSGVLPGQGISLGDEHADAGKKSHVMLVSDSLSLPAGKAQDVELRFRVEDGFHINSHKPKDELLIPTELKLSGSSGARIQGQTYPAGTEFHLQVGAGETLDVYQGEFRIKVFVVAPKGASTLDGVLKYQACDRASCYPPRTLPVHVAVTGN